MALREGKQLLLVTWLEKSHLEMMKGNKYFVLRSLLYLLLLEIHTFNFEQMKSVPCSVFIEGLLCPRPREDGSEQSEGRRWPHRTVEISLPSPLFPLG